MVGWTAEQAMTMASVLIVDDDKMMRDSISDIIHHVGHFADTAANLEEGIALASANLYDVVFLDVWMPDGNGLEALPKFKSSQGKPEIIIITGMGDADGAELAIKSGAWDYIEKGGSIKDLSLSLKRALEYREQKEAKKPRLALKKGNIIGESPAIKQCLDLMARAASSENNVLITGETGTGKELFARAIHENSTRTAGDFVVVDCTALPDTLVESMLFGHERGAFTGADRPKEGLFRHAHKGTLFLDEIGELPLPLQKVFLRVLQERRFRPIGGKKEIESNFRLLAATNRNLEKMVQEGTFRQDLLFRIQTISIQLPPLRERIDDIREIALNHINKTCQISGEPVKGFSPDFFETLELYNWPGNVRELLNTLDKVMSDAFDEPTLFPRHLPTKIRVQAARRQVKGRQKPEENREAPPTLVSMQAYLDEAKTIYLADLMSHTQGNIKKACEISGLSRSHLYQLLKRYTIAPQAD